MLEQLITSDIKSKEGIYDSFVKEQDILIRYSKELILNAEGN